MYKFLKRLKMKGRQLISGYLLEKEDGTTIEVTRRQMLKEVYAGNVKDTTAYIVTNRYCTCDRVTGDTDETDRIEDASVEDMRILAAQDEKHMRGVGFIFDGVDELMLGTEYTQRAAVLTGGPVPTQDILPLEIKAKLIFGVTGGLSAVPKKGDTVCWDAATHCHPDNEHLKSSWEAFRKLKRQGYTLGYLLQNTTAERVTYGGVTFGPYEQKEVCKSNIATAIDNFEPRRFINGVVARHCNSGKSAYSYGLVIPQVNMPIIQCGELSGGNWVLKAEYADNVHVHLSLNDKDPDAMRQRLKAHRRELAQQLKSSPEAEESNTEDTSATPQDNTGKVYNIFTGVYE